jgi:Tfp pilus assembly protein PilO
MTGVTRHAAAIGLGVMMLGGLVLLVMPAHQSRQHLRDEIVALEEELSKPNSSPELIARLEDQLGRLEALRDQRMKPIPDDRDVAGLVRDLSEMLDDLRLTEREITTGASKDLDEATSMPMSVMLRGPFPAIAEAVERIESLERLVRVQRLRVTAGRSGKGTVDRGGSVRADIMIEVFYDPREVMAMESER